MHSSRQQHQQHKHLLDHLLKLELAERRAVLELRESLGGREDVLCGKQLLPRKGAPGLPEYPHSLPDEEDVGGHGDGDAGWDAAHRHLDSQGCGAVSVWGRGEEKGSFVRGTAVATKTEINRGGWVLGGRGGGNQRGQRQGGCRGRGFNKCSSRKDTERSTEQG